MKKHLLIVPALLIAALLAVPAPSAAAATPADLSIVALMVRNPENPDGPMSGTFTATGPICGEGTIQDYDTTASGGQAGGTLKLFVHKVFTCNDGSGTFEMDMQVLIGTRGTTARWIITAGSGDYVGLFGNGGLTAVWLDDNTLQDTYTGKVQLTPKTPDVTIVSPMHVNEDGSVDGTFTATGPAVDAGLMCAQGTVQDVESRTTGWQSDILLAIYVHKVFTCDDGSGTFEMDMHVLVSPRGDQARWVITSGTGAYVALAGNGGLTGTPVEDGAFVDSYFGNIHLAPNSTDVTMVSQMTIPAEGAPYGTFTAYGPLVDAGLLCSSGQVLDVDSRTTGWQSDILLAIYVHKLFTCDDASGTFEMDMHVLISPRGDQARWVITGGTGNYASLSGNGGLVGVGVDESTFVDTYWGNLQLK